ncbi:isochorismatase family protein [Rhodanobacter glycinis]|uniref:Isochorismatase family protein n=1 Tax=Rhodanobacter glycinis TaxID=582702 RepID=A0A5B9DWP7_9GAMM|nr:isochorismatase family protein [Rhodanobacter glycinis]QEE24402.1 isochorismatase family protein [Rhodanobacter glycinis]
MTVTILDPKSALIVVDLQKGIVSLPTVHPMNGVLKHVGVLAEAFRNCGLPVVLVNVAGSPSGRTEQSKSLRDLPLDWSDFIPELNQQPQDHVVTKHTPGAFTKTGLDAHLKSLGVTQVVVVGVATSNGVEVTARQAYELGFNVTLATDAMTDAHADAHTYSTTRVFPRIGETGTAQEIISLMNKSTQP